MKKKIIILAKKKLRQLCKKYDGFNTVMIDNWRGYRFIYDLINNSKCINCCKNCPLSNLLKNEKEGLFSMTLYPASEADKKLFGPERYLNCKTLEQYKQCYITFLLKKTNTKKKLQEELSLIKEFRILYAKNTKNKLMLERQFRNDIITTILKQTNKNKADIIQSIVKTWPISKIGTGETNMSCLRNKNLIPWEKDNL